MNEDLLLARLKREGLSHEHAVKAVVNIMAVLNHPHHFESSQAMLGGFLAEGVRRAYRRSQCLDSPTSTNVPPADGMDGTSYSTAMAQLTH